MKRIVTAILFVVTGLSLSFGQSVIGTWKTIDDETGKAKSYVEITERDGKLYGKITKLLNREPGEDENPICDLCSDDRKNKKVIGLEIIRDMKKDGDRYSKGTILDPNNGETYECKLWIDAGAPDLLNVRGYIAFFYRTQVWHRVK